MMIFLKQKNKGFSLIEIMISLAIFMVIFSMVVGNFRYSERLNNFKLQAFDLEDSIRAVQNMTLTGKKIKGIIPNNAYGINFGVFKDEYSIYGDKINNSKNILDDLDIIDSVYIMKEDIVIYDIICYDSERENYYSLEELSEDLDIIFYPPKANILLNRNASYSNCEIQLRSNEANGVWKIFIDANIGKVWSEFE